MLGITFKENVPDARNSKVADIVTELRSFGVGVQVHIELTTMNALSPAGAVILAVAHDAFISGGWPFVTRLLKGGGGIVFDVKSMLDRCQRPPKIELWRL